MAVGLYYHNRDLVVSLNRTFISSEEQHDDQLLHELLRCLKALSTSEIGCFALRSSCPTPFVQLVSLLYSDKRPGDVPTRQLIVDLYRNDRLMKGELMIRGQRVDLSRLRANLLTVIAEGDHITPPCQSEAVLTKVGSHDKELFRVPGGHIGIMAGSGAHKRTWPHIDAWLGRRSD